MKSRVKQSAISTVNIRANRTRQYVCLLRKALLLVLNANDTRYKLNAKSIAFHLTMFGFKLSLEQVQDEMEKFCLLRKSWFTSDRRGWQITPEGRAAVKPHVASQQTVTAICYCLEDGREMFRTELPAVMVDAIQKVCKKWRITVDEFSIEPSGANSKRTALQ